MNMRSLRFFAVAAGALLTLCGAAQAQDKPIPARIVTTVELPTWYHEGLHFDGKYIWVANGLKGNIWVVDPDSGKVERELKPAGTFTEAVISNDKELCIVTDWDMEKLYTARIEDGALVAQKEVAFGRSHPAGIAWNGKELFVITWTRSLTGTRFAILKLNDTFKTVRSYPIKNIQEPSQLAWDGKYLWVSSWYDRRIYKLDPDTMDILGHIKSPVKKTTGIAWDGAFLWVTGTYSDLYKLELQ